MGIGSTTEKSDPARDSVLRGDPLTSFGGDSFRVPFGSGTYGPSTSRR